MQIKFDGGNVQLIREKSDRRARNESDLFFSLRNELRARGLDCIKRRPDRDGHLTSMPFYIRDRKKRWAIGDDNYAIRDAAREFNESGRVCLSLTGPDGEDTAKILLKELKHAKNNNR